MASHCKSEYIEPKFCLIIEQAYHDMATHDIDSGTGGLDASIAYELDRPQVDHSRV
jgi:hypothetical protein